MRKTINLFLEESKLIQIFLVMFFVFGIVIVFTIGFLNIIIGTHVLITREELMLSMSMSILIALITTMLVSLSRKSRKFWDYAKQLECKIDGINDKDDLLIICSDELEELKTMSCGTPHYYEVIRLYTIIKTKYKYVK